MNILGISPLDKDATVSLVVDGQLKYAIAEERLSRRKMHAGFPHLALEKVLDLAGLHADDIDSVVYAFLDAEKEAKLMRRNWDADYALNRQKTGRRLSSLIREARGRVTRRDLKVHGLSSAMETMPKGWLKSQFYNFASSDGWLGDRFNRWQFRRWLDAAKRDHEKFQRELIDGLKRFGLADKLERVEHHLSHVSNAFYLSGFEKALAVTIDAYGSGLSGTITLADGSGFKRLSSLETPYSLGLFYDTVTSALGFSPDRHAGKIVGLAAYGDPEVLSPVLESLFEWSEDGGFRMRRSSENYLSRRLATQFPRIDMAAAYQTVLERTVARWVEHYVKQTGIDSVVLSGGVAANVKMNQRIFEIPGVNSIYIHCGMGDGGCGTGAALLKAQQHGSKLARMRDAFLGPEYSDERLERCLKLAGMRFWRSDDVELEIAQMIADNHVIARFNGRMEYGPRALGNRSILYPAVDPEVNQWLNTRLGRTEFMPFAPATLYEERHRCYKNIDGAEYTAQFMTVTFDCTDWMIENCPAAVHIDGTARPQLVTEQSNPSFYRILTEYSRLTGLPSMINTSFNMHEEPIVCTPEDAIRAFTMGRLDYLAMGPFLVPSAELAVQNNASKQQATVIG